MSFVYLGAHRVYMKVVILGSKIGSKIPHFLDPQKVHLCAVDLEDQKVRLRAVWMGRKIESFWSSILGSILELKFRVDK